jgi:hypothetical protein
MTFPPGIVLSYQGRLQVVQLANQSFQNYTTTAGHNPAATASKPASLIVDHFSPVDLHYLYATQLWGSILSPFQRGSSLQCFSWYLDSIKWAQYDSHVRPTHQHSLIGRHMALISDHFAWPTGCIYSTAYSVKDFSIIEMNEYESVSGA